MRQESTAFLLTRMLRNNNIHVDESELEFQINSHPSYPSLHSITGSLKFFNIENLALELPRTKESIEQLPESFLCQVHSKEGTPFVHAIKSNDSIEVIFDKSKKEKLSVDDFIESWLGIVVVVEKAESPQQATRWKMSWNNGLLLVSIAAILLVFGLGATTFFQISNFILAIFGATVAFAIVRQELGLSIGFVDKICTGTGEKSSCSAVLKSEGASLFKFLKLSDAVVVYFLGMIVYVMFSVIVGSEESLLSLPIILSVPFTLYSIHYQHSILKKWCTLCLSVVAIIWVQVVLVAISNNFSLSYFLKAEDLLFLILAFLPPMIFWRYTSNLLVKGKELKELQIEHFRFKRNYNVYKALSDKKEFIDTKINDVQEISFGHAEGLVKIVIITNPGCSHCKDAHMLVEKLLKNFSTKVHITIRFNVNLEHVNESVTQASTRLLEIFNKEGKEECIIAMHELYSKISLETWLEKWGQTENEAYQTILQKERDWCISNDLNFTPEVVVNGVSFPTEYDRDDLLYFIDDLDDDEFEKQEILKPIMEAL